MLILIKENCRDYFPNFPGHRRRRFFTGEISRGKNGKGDCRRYFFHKLKKAGTTGDNPIYRRFIFSPGEITGNQNFFGRSCENQIFFRGS